jgi:hypothetical protein
MTHHMPGKLTIFAWFFLIAIIACEDSVAATLLAGVAKVDVTDREAGPVNDPLYVKALVLKNDSTTIVVATVDAVAIGEIGPIRNDYLETIRKQITEELGIPALNVLVNASHCHGIVCKDVDKRTVEAVKRASATLAPVTLGVGKGTENRIMENRRLRLKSGAEADIRHAYSLSPNEEVAAVGPVDPEIGIVRLDRLDGSTLALVYHFACHPIEGIPSGGNSADFCGFASKAIEESFDDDTMALFLQGCAGDVHPVLYKDVNRPRDAEPLGNLLALSTMRVARAIKTREDSRLQILHEVIELPIADLTPRIYALEAELDSLVNSLKGTSLNLETFLPLVVKYSLSDEFPSGESHRYLHDTLIGKDDWKRHDAINRQNLKQYVQNIHTMEQITRVQTNLALLRRHQTRNADAAKRVLQVEVLGVRIGECAIVTFPGEPVVEVGLNIKRQSPHEHTFVVGYTNGYIYYAPTAAQLSNTGSAQEDSDCLLAPQWQSVYEHKALEMLKRL